MQINQLVSVSYMYEAYLDMAPMLLIKRELTANSVSVLGGMRLRSVTANSKSDTYILIYTRMHARASSAA